MEQKHNIEVEIRGRLSPDQAQRLQALIAKEGREITELDRYLVNFSTPEMVASKVDLRARVTNGKPELIVKRGAWGGAARAEFAVRCEAGEFEKLVSAIVALGYNSGIGAHRKIRRCDFEEVELSLVEVPGHSQFYEAEIVTNSEGAASAEIALKQWAERNGLPVFSKEDFLTYIDLLDMEANDVLDFGDERAWQILRERVGQD